MGSSRTSTWARARRFLVAAGLAAAVGVPVVALAASASFSSRTPGSGSTTTNTRPTISVQAYDANGIKGSGAFTMSVDGKAVSPSVMYYTTGSFDPAHPDYRRPKISYRPASALTAGSHTVYVRVKDRAGRVSSTTWSFKVAGPEAPYAASFSSASPAKGGSTYLLRPSVSVKVYDKYGVKGAGTYSMSIDGKAVTPALAYTKAGSYAYLTLSGRPAADLTLGSHTVSVKVKDLHAHSTTYAWSFTVSVPPEQIVEMPVTIASSSCSSCHVGYPGSHPMTDCAGCHGPGRPVEGVVYTISAHTQSCASMPCHRQGATKFPHVLGSDCSACHAGTFSGIPVAHGAPSASSHDTTNTFCAKSGCHQVSLTKEHYRHTVDGVRLSCATCHSSTDPLVTAALESGSTDCLSCHPFKTTSHPNTTAAHANAGLSCNDAGCHSGDLPSIHLGACDPCHAAGKTPTKDCTVCHTAAPHASLSGQHTAPDQTCTATTCHGSNVMTIHAPRGALACASCHALGTTPSLICTTCHTTGYDALHALASGPHQVANECTASGCHATGGSATRGDVGLIHTTGPTKPGCVVCHKPAATTANCLDCHQRHVAIAAHKTDSACGSCHGTDVSVIHTTGAGAPGCVACHHDGATLTTDCATVGCHSTSTTAVHSSHETTLVSGTITINGVSYGPYDCQQCHASRDLQTLHGENGTDNSCPKCHPAPASTAAPGSFACAQGGCHTATSGNMKKMHGSVDAAHIAASLPVGWTCTTGTCHTGSNDVAKIHAGKQGCATCHGSGKTPTLNCVVSGCHPDGAPSSHGGHPVTQTTGTIRILGVDYLGVSCASCHKVQELQAIHGGATQCGTCHPSPRDTFTTWNGGCVQGGCHSVSSTKPMHAAIDADHSPAAGFAVSCGGANCHGTITSIAALHASGPGCAACHANQIHAASNVCTDCHATHQLTILHAASPAAGTVTIGSNVYGPFSCGTCHSPLDLRTIHGGNCAACHSPVSTLLGGTWTRGCVQGGCHTAASTKPFHAASTTAHAFSMPTGWTCLTAGCHTGSDLAQLHEDKDSCATCHGGTKTPTGTCASTGCHDDVVNGLPSAHLGVHEVTRGDSCAATGCHPDGTNLTTIHAGGCATCHSADASDRVKAAIAAHNTDCANCHGFSDHLAYHEVTRTDSCAEAAPCHGSTDTNLTTIHAQVGCMACHAPDASKLIQTSISTHNKDCAHCHGFSDHVSQHAVDRTQDSCAGASCHPASLDNLTTIHASGGCETCHSATVRDAVKQAIASHSKACSSCHAFADHVDLHAVDRTQDSCAGASCHPASLDNLTTLHASGGCETCHSATVRDAVKQAIASHSKACASCHPFADHVALHDVVRNDSCAEAACHGSADTNLTTIHAAGGCATCHAPTSTVIPHATIAAAIANHDKSCANCHGSGDHAALHEVTRTDSCAAPTCHGSTDTNLTTIHAAGGCATCHADAVLERVKAAVAAGNKDCANCHGFSDHSLLHAVDRTQDSCTGPQCHPAALDNLMTIHTAGCSTCHSDTASEAVKSAILTHNIACAACHPFADHLELHDVVRSDSCADAACHGSTDTNLTTIHASGGCATCHAPTTTVIPHATIAAAIANHDRSCANCHGFTDHITQHAVDRSQDSCAGTGCHPAELDNLTTIHVAGCDTCHEPTSTVIPSATIAAAIASHDKSCAVCHAFTSHVTQHEVTRNDTCVGTGCHPDTLTNLTTIHTGGCGTCHAPTVPQQVKDAIAAHNKACAACHETTISSLTLHPNYATFHNATASGCTGAYCHPASALDVHGRTGCVNSCHKNPVASLTLNCNSGCHTGVYGGDTLTAHVGLHTTDYYWICYDFGGSHGPTCQNCHSYEWHSDGNPVFGPISSATSCSSINSSWGPLTCHSGTPGYPGARGWDHSCDFACH